jgi:YegS/Rv2252/BmrU family lipid kinase
LENQLKAQAIQPETLLALTRAQAVAGTKKALSDSPEKFQLIIVAGGDGTLNGVLSALLEVAASNEAAPLPPLAILPFGTVNVLARELGIPLTLDKAIAVASRGFPRPLDIGLFQGQPFLLMAGIGFDGAVVRAVRPEAKSIFGALAYVGEALRLLLAYPIHQFKIDCDGETTETPAWLVVVSNATTYAYKLCFAPQARIDDGLLDICIFPDYGRRNRLGQILWLFCNRPQNCPLLYLSGRKVEISVSPSAIVQIDGDPGPTITAGTFEALARKIQIMVPPGKADKP